MPGEATPISTHTELAPDLEQLREKVGQTIKELDGQNSELGGLLIDRYQVSGEKSLVFFRVSSSSLASRANQEVFAIDPELGPVKVVYPLNEHLAAKMHPDLMSAPKETKAEAEENPYASIKVLTTKADFNSWTQAYHEAKRVASEALRASMEEFVPAAYEVVTEGKIELPIPTEISPPPIESPPLPNGNA